MLIRLYEELLTDIISKKIPNIRLESLNINPTEITKLACYNALEKIKKINEDDSLDDPQCFEKIERIICLFESMGSDGGNRHDF